MKPMSKRLLIPGLILVILFQTAVLVMVYVNARMPAWTGREVRLATRPVDPRSLFRGNYALLNYDISRIPAARVNACGRPRPNQKIYVTLVPAENGIHGYGGVSFEKPAAGLFIRGRLKNQSFRTAGHYRVYYGIEAYFAPKDKAMALEKALRSSALAAVWIDDSGKAALKAVEPRGKK